MPVGTTRTRYPFFLPPPVTANAARSKGRIGVERSAAPSLIALTSGLVGVSSHQPRAELLFIGAATVTLGLYFVVPPRTNDRTHPITSAFLQRMPDVFAACGCILILLGIGSVFPNELALIPLFLSISFAALAALFGTTPAAWIAAMLYGVALVSLATFVVLVFMA